MNIGLYPGTFDPVTKGHEDIIRRAMRLFDELVVGVAVNRDKSPLFNLNQRVNFVNTVIESLPNVDQCKVKVIPFDNLLVDCARENGANVLIRGLRAVSDFEFEYQMVGMNRSLDPDIETVFLMADTDHQAIASRLVKEVARLGGDVRPFVAPFVVSALKEKLKKTKG